MQGQLQKFIRFLREQQCAFLKPLMHHILILKEMVFLLCSIQIKFMQHYVLRLRLELS
ncbi:hypothetical protein AERO8C_160261 [Aeromonas veronii]|uniref:Uncharacterized protein n=1 Tax=Aeromonas veronii TaxID=654 RepID=A0A653KZE1_AERVE|nr:hypothetical protein AERO8C_160261 [Aeromonas veronii]